MSSLTILLIKVRFGLHRDMSKINFVWFAFEHQRLNFCHRIVHTIVFHEDLGGIHGGERCVERKIQRKFLLTSRDILLFSRRKAQCRKFSAYCALDFTVYAGSFSQGRTVVYLVLKGKVIRLTLSFSLGWTIE